MHPNGSVRSSSIGSRSCIQFDDKVDSVTPLALEPDSNVLVSWAAIENAGVSTVTIGLLVKCLDQGDSIPPRYVEGSLLGDYLQPGRFFSDSVFEYKSVTRHSVANDKVVRLV
ncbi:hypothetical protein K0M31_017939 [Melipona bicolor]|uniref:Uncharacterized protein n=1 Tax=Melipona bicolor TaxID=60889 RepID=A0AA40G692_9HYME|nr:hypothetical protein K0M31_017939 [Melipona bicolor]